MVALIRYGIATILLAAAPCIAAESLTERIDAHIAQPRFAAASWGIAVVSLEDGHTVYAHDEGRLLLPASTAKLYTAAFALDRLGPDYRTHTDVLAAGSIARGRLHGSLVLRGRGDPTLSGDEWAEQLAARIGERGIRRVDGAVIGDDTVFSGPAIGSGWEASDLQAAYGAAAGGLDVDENTMTVALSQSGVDVAPADAAITVAAQPRDGVELYRAPGSSTVHVLGGVAEGGATKRIRLSLPDPALSAARRLQAALIRQGIRVDGEARSVHWPVAAPTGETIASVPSPTLGDILRTGLKRSQNLYLQSVFLLTGLETAEACSAQTSSANSPDGPGSGRSQPCWRNNLATVPKEDLAAEALTHWLSTKAIGPSSTTLDEGTGLSRHDLTTPASLVRLLTFMDRSPQAAAWRDLLPVAGVDGTLVNRMRGTAAEANVQAKTGSMSFVNTLAGYVTTRSGERRAFAIMLNNYRAPPHSAETVPPVSSEVDAVAVMLAEAEGHL
ncbi:D-alanyl-D-alanine carboxypeptidase/D-alanyl-D-alanine-endopeptidase [Luteibacter sp.]|uniref:D-alanyl-D-alanine carboxypeptidase/D-alanyl-D-alanine endopeptidase n=1 Tax=Luteibacter sp. TaxID=1886636 RepID=UPI002807CC2F|nr:D-alanyl-D-alanine carboxypeptidase/D-alanyl-D-alanine-endopeptidase [Luteibacter sp.]MDQ8049843.1 D-alanyl-D-alanine carboxypeptidase/D-alanyl-D-alanine-endopeptidase [Luteibacter sp.]